MFLRLFTELREAKTPVSLREYLSLMEAMDHGVIGMDTAAAPDASVGFAIPIARALAFAERIV